MHERVVRLVRSSLHRMIAKRAYKKWEEQGHKHGNDVKNWLEAEQELMKAIRTHGVQALIEELT